MEFEIQIWVLNLGREVEYTKIRGNEFPFERLTFIMSRRNGKKTGVCYDFKNPASHPWINSLLLLETKSFLRCFHYFSLGVNYQNTGLTDRTLRHQVLP